MIISVYLGFIFKACILLDFKDEFDNKTIFSMISYSEVSYEQK